jgi:hypothetical protein
MKVLRNILLSVVFGTLIWFIAHSLLLPVREAVTAQGMGWIGALSNGITPYWCLQNRTKSKPDTPVL